jgi:hypothetical protein
MALLAVRTIQDMLLALDDAEGELFAENHIFEPEYHQQKYVEPCERLKALTGSFQVGDRHNLKQAINRGNQPKYADDEDDPSTLQYEGMVLPDGSVLDSGNGTRNVCALKSNCVRWGFVDLSLARSVDREWAATKGKRASVKKNDVLVNSTGDGTIGRVAVYDFDAPAVVDGHISIIRFKDEKLAWYVAAFLLSDDGQKQLYRYINGSSGQVELYPQDIARVWVPGASTAKRDKIAGEFRKACEKHYEFYKDMRRALSLVDSH